MPYIPKSENLTIVTQNIIPDLAEIPVNGVINLTVVGSAGIPVDEYTVSGQTITWDFTSAEYNLEVGEIVVANYLYDDVYPYDGSDSTHNPIDLSYERTVYTQNIVPKLIHNPVASTFAVLVNGSPVLDGVHWTRSGRDLTWISGTDLEVGDAVTFSYRRSISV